MPSSPQRCDPPALDWVAMGQPGFSGHHSRLDGYFTDAAFTWPGGQGSQQNQRVHFNISYLPELMCRFLIVPADKPTEPVAIEPPMAPIGIGIVWFAGTISSPALFPFRRPFWV
jgi:hypothetical protein